VEAGAACEGWRKETAPRRYPCGSDKTGCGSCRENLWCSLYGYATEELAQPGRSPCAGDLGGAGTIAGGADSDGAERAGRPVGEAAPTGRPVRSKGGRHGGKRKGRATLTGLTGWCVVAASGLGPRQMNEARGK